VKPLPDRVKKELCESFLKRIPEMKVVPLGTYKKAKAVLKSLEKEIQNAG